jgi:hypothetical protein
LEKSVFNTFVGSTLESGTDIIPSASRSGKGFLTQKKAVDRDGCATFLGDTVIPLERAFLLPPLVEKLSLALGYY